MIDPRTGAWNREAEIDMLLAFRKFAVDIADFDLLAGFNSDTFDTPYVLKRADALGIGAVMRDVGRVVGELTAVRSSTFESKALGKRTDLQARMSGRVGWDVLRVVRRELKLRSYTLNAVAGEVLGRKKNEMSHDRIGPSWIGPKANDLTRRTVLECVGHSCWARD